MTAKRVAENCKTITKGEDWKNYKDIWIWPARWVHCLGSLGAQPPPGSQTWDFNTFAKQVTLAVIETKHHMVKIYSISFSLVVVSPRPSVSLWLKLFFRPTCEPLDPCWSGGEGFDHNDWIKLNRKNPDCIDLTWHIYQPRSFSWTLFMWRYLLFERAG